MSHVYRWHPRLSAGIDGPMVGKSPLHLQQSDLDGACGQHSALMALMLFGEVTRDDLEGKPKKALSAFWKSARPHYFVGTKPNKLASFFKPYRHAVSSRVGSPSGTASPSCCKRCNWNARCWSATPTVPPSP